MATNCMNENGIDVWMASTQLRLRMINLLTRIVGVLLKQGGGIPNLQDVNNSHYWLHPKLYQVHAHNYIETLHGNFRCRLQTKAFKSLARCGIWTHDLQITCLTLMMSSTHWEVQIIIEFMISACPDSSDDLLLSVLKDHLNWRYGKTDYWSIDIN